MPWKDNIGTPFVLRSNDASNSSNLESDEVPFLQSTQDDVNDQNASIADDLSLDPNDLLSDWEGQDVDVESWEQATPTIASPDLISRACEPESSSGVSNFINSLTDTQDTSIACQPSEGFSQIVAQSVVSQTSTHLPVMPWDCDDNFAVGSLSVPI